MKIYWRPSSFVIVPIYWKYRICQPQKYRLSVIFMIRSRYWFLKPYPTFKHQSKRCKWAPSISGHHLRIQARPGRNVSRLRGARRHLMRMDGERYCAVISLETSSSQVSRLRLINMRCHLEGMSERLCSASSLIYDRPFGLEKVSLGMDYWY